MSDIKAYLYSLDPLDSADGKWDYGLIKEIFDKNNIEQITVSKIPVDDRAFVVIPGSGNAGMEEKINTQLSNINRLVLFITGDESARFNVDLISKPNIEIWIHYPHKRHKKYNKFFVGAPKHIEDNLPEYPVKEYDIFFSGQINHTRRRELSQALSKMPQAMFNPTAGFSLGFTPREYYDYMSKSRIVPCPAGNVVIDTFRFFEAIEMLCLPIGDLKNSQNINFDFFNFVEPAGVPVKVLSDWNLIPDTVSDLLMEYPENMHTVVAWWIKYKRDFSLKIMEQINE